MVQKWEDKIVDLLALLQGSIDFPDTIEMDRSQIQGILRALADDMKRFTKGTFRSCSYTRG